MAGACVDSAVTNGAELEITSDEKHHRGARFTVGLSVASEGGAKVISLTIRRGLPSICRPSGDAVGDGDATVTAPGP